MGGGVFICSVFSIRYAQAIQDFHYKDQSNIASAAAIFLIDVIGTTPGTSLIVQRGNGGVTCKALF